MQCQRTPGAELREYSITLFYISLKMKMGNMEHASKHAGDICQICSHLRGDEFFNSVSLNVNVMKARKVVSSGTLKRIQTSRDLVTRVE
jgi:hypothetical protein